MNKLLVAVDGFQASLEAIKKTIEIAKQYNAEVVAVQVEEDVPLFYQEKTWEREGRSKEQQVPFFATPLDLAVTYGQKNGVAVRPIKAEGTIAAVIIKIAKDLKVDMIIMGESGRRGMQKIHFGSVAESVVRASPIPTLVIKKGSIDINDLAPLMAEINGTAAALKEEKAPEEVAEIPPEAEEVFNRRLRISYGFLAVYALIYFSAALFTSAEFKDLAQIELVRMPLGVWMGLAVFITGVGITRLYLIKERG